MSSKIKAFLIYFLCFAALFLVTRFIMVEFFNEKSIWTGLVSIIAAGVLSPKPHKEETEEGRVYGLKSIFLKQIYYLNN